MKKFTLVVSTITINLFSLSTYSQENAIHHFSNTDEAKVFGMIEFSLLLIATALSFMTARILRGGKVGNGMIFLAIGFSIMALGHLHIQIEHIFGYNLPKELMGITAGNYAWYLAMLLTWLFSAVGFYKIYKASRI